MIKDGVEDGLQRLVSREKFKNISLQDTLNKIKKALTKEKVEREALECKNAEMEKRIEKIKEVDAEYKRLKSQFAKCEEDRKKYTEQIDWLRSREEEVINRIDLDEIDLLTERLDIYGVVPSSNKKPKTVKPKYKIPKLDFEKVRLMKEREEEEEYEEEEEETEDDANSHAKYLKDGKVIASDDSRERFEVLRQRKEQVIALLNQTYDNE